MRRRTTHRAQATSSSSSKTSSRCIHIDEAILASRHSQAFLQTLGRGEGRADTSASIDALLAQVNAFSKEFGSTVESKDAAIAIELAEATKEVSNLDAEIGKVDKEVRCLRKTGHVRLLHASLSAGRPSQATSQGQHRQSHRRDQGFVQEQERH